MTKETHPQVPTAPLVLIALATFLALVVFTQPLTTLEAMTASLALSPSQQAWVMSGMPLGAACGLLTAGALGDTLGRRRTFAGGLWLTAVSSVGAALSPDGWLLVGMRIVQGLGSAGIMACGLGLLGQIYEGAARRRATAIWAAALGGGVAAGPIAAALLLPLGGWQADHWLIALSSAVLAGLTSAHLPESARTGQRVDLTGSLLLTLGLGCLLAALTEARLGALFLVAALAVSGVLLLGLFARVERRIANPILQLGMFREAGFSGATLAAFASGAGVLALMSMVPTLLERGFGIAPLRAAIILLAWSGVTVLAALAAHRLPEPITSRQRVIASMLGCACGQALLILARDDASWAAVLPGLFVAGLSNGILNASLGHEAIQTVAAERSAMGSAANNTARYLGSALGIALISVLIAAPDAAGLFAGWQRAVWASSMIGLVGTASMFVLSRRRRKQTTAAR